jgi:hypothetical protein
VRKYSRSLFLPVNGPLPEWPGVYLKGDAALHVLRGIIE